MTFEFPPGTSLLNVSCSGLVDVQPCGVIWREMETKLAECLFNTCSLCCTDESQQNKCNSRVNKRVNKVMLIYIGLSNDENSFYHASAAKTGSPPAASAAAVLGSRALILWCDVTF